MTHLAVRSESLGHRFLRCDHCGVVFYEGKVWSKRITWGPNDCPPEDKTP